jgi:AcrR family transcriptional regulator
MSLYRYVPSKADLLTHMQDAALGPLPEDRVRDVDWRTGLTAWTRAVLARFRLHPWSATIPLTGPPLMPRNTEWLDWCLGHLDGTPLAPLEKLSTVMLLSGYAQNEVARETSLRLGRTAQDAEAGPSAEASQSSDVGMGCEVSPGSEAAAASADGEDVRYAETLARLIDPARLPHLDALLTEGLFSAQPYTDVDDGDAFMLDYGLHRILDGIGLLIESRRST